MELEFTHPKDLTNEEGVLCAVLADQGMALDEATRFIRPESFFHPPHRLIYEAMLARHQRGEKSLDFLAVREELIDRGTHGAVGDALLFELGQGKGFLPANVDSYAKSVRRAQQMRAVVDVGVELVQLAMSGRTLDADDVLDRAQQRLAAAASGAGAGLSDLLIKAILPRTFDRIFEAMNQGGSLPGLSSGIPSLDKLTGGFSPSQLIVVAARTGVGKTALICNIALAVARAARVAWQAEQEAGREVPPDIPGGVLIFSLEMAETEMLERMLCVAARIDGQKLRRGDLDEQEQSELSDAAGDLEPLTVMIDGTPRQTVSTIASIAKRAQRRYGIGMVVVDYIGLVEGEERGVERSQQIAVISRRLKVLAKEMKIPVVVLAQLNRNPVNREDKRPRLSDIRDSGAIEQDADSVILVHRPSEFDENDRPGEVDLIVAKNRAGPKGTVPLVWMPHCMKFGEKAPDGPILANF